MAHTSELGGCTAGRFEKSRTHALVIVLLVLALHTDVLARIYTTTFNPTGEVRSLEPTGEVFSLVACITALVSVFSILGNGKK